MDVSSKNNTTNNNSFAPYVTPLGAWALALGTSIGWGSLVVTSNTYLSQAGPAGSIAGLLIGAVIMIVISRNYHYMITSFPDAGGAYAYSKETFGYDYGFLTSWFLSLTYAAMLWANATSLPLFARYFIGDIFRFGRLYTLFGYDVYLGEALLTLAAIFIIAVICTRHRKVTITLMIALALILSAGITICFIMCITGHGGSGLSYEPAFLPGKSSLSQMLTIACISPWAFIGFENISHSSEEFTFSRGRVFRILTAAVVSATVLYAFVLIMSVSAYPPQYSSWTEYIIDHGNLSGIEGLPAFYAAYYYMGNAGVGILVIALFGLIVTSLIGNTVALSKLLYALAKDNVISEKFSEINSHNIPGKAVMLVALLCLPIPFAGRTAIGWIVDVTTIGATLIYGFVSGSTIKVAKGRGDSRELMTGRLGLAAMTVIATYLLIPNFFRIGSMERETYFLFVVWGILGFIFFRTILKRDTARRFGKSIVVWIALLTLVLMIALIWMSQSLMITTDEAMKCIHEHYIEEGAIAENRLADEDFIEEQMSELTSSNRLTMLAATGMFAFAIVILFTNYSYMNKRQRESEEALGQARTIAYTDSLTGVKNKTAFTEQEHQLDEHIHEGVPDDFSIVVCDVNGLKYVNDTFGHKAGDEYIREASRLICETFQHSPVFRIGGDEFVVILKGRDHDSRLEILRGMNERIEDNIGSRRVVIAAGMSDYDPSKDKSAHDVFARADKLMYARKQELKKLGSISR